MKKNIIFILSTLLILSVCKKEKNDDKTLLLLGALYFTQSSTATSCTGVSGTGSLTVNIDTSALPAGATAGVKITGPSNYSTTLTKSQTLTNLKAGSYKLSSIGSTSDPIVRKAYSASYAPSNSPCINNGETPSVKITYGSLLTISNKVWLGSGNSTPSLVGYSSSSINTTGTASAAFTGKTIGKNATVFDKEGNLWVPGATLSDPLVARYPRSELSTSDNVNKKKSDFSIPLGSYNINTVVLAFDPSGNLWVSSGNEIYKFTATQDGFVEKTPSVTIKGNTLHSRGIAFDSSGNLWSSRSHSSTSVACIQKYNAGRLGSDINSPDLQINFPNNWYASEIAFDSSGKLWMLDHIKGDILSLTTAQQALTGTQSLTEANFTWYHLSNGTPSAIAFDESGRLWLSGDAARIKAFNLTGTSGITLTPAINITSASTSSELNYGESIALFPAPAGLPLYHSFP